MKDKQEPQKPDDRSNPMPPEGCTCGALWTVRRTHGKKDCPFNPYNQKPLPAQPAQGAESLEEHCRMHCKPHLALHLSTCRIGNRPVSKSISKRYFGI